MKKIAVAALVLLASACSKQVLQKNGTRSGLQGRWDWVEATGGLIGHRITPATQGFSATVKFKNDSVYMYRNDTLQQADRYTIIKKRTIYSTDSLEVLHFAAAGYDRVIMRLKQDTLVLADNYYDGYSWLYVKHK